MSKILVWIGYASTTIVLGCIGTALVLMSRSPAPERTLSTILPPYVVLPNGRNPFWPDQFVRTILPRDSLATGEGVVRYFEAKLGRPLNILELSGGGQNGAFGAGFLKGWRESGTRPRFDLATGVSTGALLATHAFLGTPKDDEVLEEIFTEVDQSDVYYSVGMLGVLAGDSSLLNSEPLQELIAKYITPEVLARVAKAHDENRRLWVATTNLDYNQTWVWDMTLIAKVNAPNALELYRKVVLASASPPAAFPPVEIDGHLLADGATRENLLVVGLSGERRPGPPRFGPGNVYVILNGRSKGDPVAVSPDIRDLAGTGIGVVMSSSTQSILLLAYLTTKAQGYRFHVAEVPPDIDIGTNALKFDNGQMRAVFAAGYELGKRDSPWEPKPPHSEAYPDWVFEDR